MSVRSASRAQSGRINGLTVSTTTAIRVGSAEMPPRVRLITRYNHRLNAAASIR